MVFNIIGDVTNTQWWMECRQKTKQSKTKQDIKHTEGAKKIESACL